MNARDPRSIWVFGGGIVFGAVAVLLGGAPWIVAGVGAVYMLAALVLGWRDHLESEDWS